jgi:hypothetical protein
VNSNCILLIHNVASPTYMESRSDERSSRPDLGEERVRHVFCGKRRKGKRYGVFAMGEKMYSSIDQSVQLVCRDSLWIGTTASYIQILPRQQQPGTLLYRPPIPPRRLPISQTNDPSGKHASLTPSQRIMARLEFRGGFGQQEHLHLNSVVKRIYHLDLY